MRPCAVVTASVLTGLAVAATFLVGCATEQPGAAVSRNIHLAGDTDPLKDRWDDPASPGPVVEPGAGVVGIRLPAEASPARKRRVRAEFMNSSQVAAYLKSGGDVAILPIGGVSATGMHVPLGSKGINVHATAIVLAERWRAIVFPPVPYSYAGETRGLPGTVSIAMSDMLAYTRALVDSLLDGGFKRVVILGDGSLRGQLGHLARTVYRDERRLVIAGRIDLLPSTEQVSAELGYEPADDIRTMASLRILGHAGVFEPGTPDVAGVAPEEPRELVSRMRQARLGAVVVQDSIEQGLPLRDCIKAGDVDKAIGIMREQAKRYDGLPAIYARYADQMEMLEEFAPWSLETWDKAVAACRYDAIPESDATPVPTVQDKDADDVLMAASAFPEEASPDYLRRYRAEFMSAGDMAERMKADPIAILPCGAFEMHGPHGPLGIDTFEAHSLATVMAKPWNAVVFPPVYYTYAGATERYPGTLSVSHEEAARYVEAVASGLLDAGFRRVCIMWVHGPGRTTQDLVLRELLHERGQVVFAFRPRLLPREQMSEQVGYRSGEDIWSLTGLKILGHPGVFVVDEPEDIGTVKLPFHTVAELSRLGFPAPWYMGLPTHHLAVRSCVRSGDEDKVIPIMREAAKQYDHVPGLMNEWLKEMEGMGHARQPVR